jgi:four helix bundle protein
MQHFSELRVWQRAHALALSIYKLTAALPSEERFGLTSQTRRAATSIPTNIAEGSKRRTSADYARFLNLAEGSAAEVEYLLMLSRDIGYVGADDVGPLLTEVSELSRMLYALRTKVEEAGRS